jgi:hypothetical protein
MPETANEYRVVWKDEAGQEDSITIDQDYHPLTLQKAQRFAEGRKAHSEYFKNTDVRVEVRQVITTDWREVLVNTEA